MATLSKGYTFGATEQVTAAKLHSLIDSATITGILAAEITDSTITDAKIASVSGAKFVTLSGIPAGAGDIPKANLDGDWDTDGTLNANSDLKIPTQKAIKTYGNTLDAAQTAKFNTSTGHNHDGTDSKLLTGLGAWVDKSASYSAQQATTDGFVVVQGYGSTNLTFQGYTDANANPTTLRTSQLGLANVSINLTMPVKKNDYWKIIITGTTTVLSVYWIPLGV